MTATLLEKARAGRRAALASLSARGDRNVISLFDEAPQPRKSVPEFRSVRSHIAMEEPHQEATVLMLTDRIAA